MVIDTPPKSDVESRPAIETASLVAVPVQPTPIDLWATQPTLDMIAKEGTASLIVINRAQSRAALTQEMSEAIRALGHPAAQTLLGNRVAFAASMGGGLTVMETAPGSKGRRKSRRWPPNCGSIWAIESTSAMPRRNMCEPQPPLAARSFSRLTNF